MKAIRVLGAIVLPLLAFAAGLYLYYELPQNRPLEEVEIVVDKGESFSSIANKLAAAGLIRYPELFGALTRFQERDRGVKAGVYVIDSTLSPREILDLLNEGQVNLIKVTVPEGLTVRETATVLEEAGLASVKDVIQANSDPEFLERVGLQGKSLEGYLFPDTYHFAEGVPPRDVLEAMVLRFREVYSPEMAAQQESLGLSLQEAVTLASIVEKETGRGGERRAVASVIHNRLKRGIPLQCDPTVIYGIKDFDGNLTRKHLETPTPYNTYVIRGLPPGPICNPGLAALQAAVEPADTRYLYFVSRNDGTHHFSETLREHNRAVRKYQLRRRR